MKQNKNIKKRQSNTERVFCPILIQPFIYWMVKRINDRGSPNMKIESFSEYDKTLLTVLDMAFLKLLQETIAKFTKNIATNNNAKLEAH